ncbi:type IV pilin protein [Vibrio misgurnus]|uniref:type IV pilin protein n=1 Tax=Vibrio TaxID=662 RepID=UPI0024170F3B|nr:type IV pilin protein [Vibrio sp. gvc]
MEMIRKFFCKPRLVWQQGMTLIELMIAVVIVGILAGIAYPAYTDYVKEGHRKQALADMAKIQLYLEEKYNHGYTDAAAGIVDGNKQCGTFCAVDITRYKIEVLADDKSYTIKAIPQKDKGQTSDQCGAQTYQEITLNHQGETTPIACWN